jgi:predicted acetyltransferase
MVENFRKFLKRKDKEAVFRIWDEIGWFEDKRSKEKENAILQVIREGEALVAEMNGAAECLVMTNPAEIRHLSENLTLSVVTAVTTGRVARKQGIATRLTARAVAEAAIQGYETAALGIFDQGFYNKLGFGNGGYEHWITFDPSSLLLKKKAPVPSRIGEKGAKQMHENRLQRLRGHGSISFLGKEITEADLAFISNGFGLGYFDEKTKKLTHHLWMDNEGEHGPCTIHWMAFKTYDQFLELLSLMKGFGDQIFSVKLREPAGIQIQDLLHAPFRSRGISNKGKYEQRMNASSYCQIRILDLEKAVEKTHLPGQGSPFNLVIEDPIEKYLPEEMAWRGVSGSYIICFGERSEIKNGSDDNLPTLTASIGAFTRMWLGVRPATGLSVTDDLNGPKALLEELDRLFLLPEPKPDWDF